MHKRTSKKRCYEQYLVPVKGQADILVTGDPVHQPLQRELVPESAARAVHGQGYLFNLYKGNPLVKKGGTMIITHPMHRQASIKEHHAPYIEFVHNLLPGNARRHGAAQALRASKFAANPAYIQKYRTGHAYHPAHPFFMWYWGEAGRQHIGRVIVVGADNEYIPKLLGYETARTMPEALEMAKDTAPPNPEITLMHIAPLMMAEVS